MAAAAWRWRREPHPERTSRHRRCRRSMAELLRTWVAVIRTPRRGRRRSATFQAYCRPSGRLRPRSSMLAIICVLGPLFSRCGRSQSRDAGGEQHRIVNRSSCQGPVGWVIDVVSDTVIWWRHVRLRDQPRTYLRTFQLVRLRTETLVMATILARGRSTIDNAAREPEIVDICSILIIR